MKPKVTETEYFQAIRTIKNYHQQIYDEMDEIADLINFNRVSMQQFLKDSEKSSIMSARLLSILKYEFDYAGIYLDEITEEMITSCHGLGSNAWNTFDSVRRSYFQQVGNSLPLGLTVENMKIVKKDRLSQLPLEENKLGE